MTVFQKQLKNQILAYLDKLIAYVEDLKAAGAETSLDGVLKAQRQRVNSSNDPHVLLQVSSGDQLAKYLKHVERLEDQADDEDTQHAARLEREGEALDTYLEKIGVSIDDLRTKVEQESSEHALASVSADRHNDFLEAIAGHLEAAGAQVSLVTALFRKKSFSELVAARKKRKRWLRTPGGKAALRKAKLRAKRHHVIDRQRSKISKMAHKVYKY